MHPDIQPEPSQSETSDRATRRADPAWLTQAATWLGLLALLYGAGTFLPEGFNWRLDFSRGSFPAWWVPWAKPLIGLLNLPAVFALTITAVAIRTHRNRRSLLPVLLAVLSLPTLWVFFLGEVAGLPLVGLLILPWGVPLVLLKPQIAAFALLSRWRWAVAAGVWLAFSILVWGPWPLDLLVVQSPEWKAMHPQDIALFPWGIALALPLMWLSRGDEDMLMAAGSFATPHLFPYHLVVLTPALARMTTGWMVGTWLLLWMPLLANWMGPEAWHFGNLAAAAFWIGLYLNRDAVRRPHPSRGSDSPR